MTKLKIGYLSLESCSGCTSNLLSLKELPQILESVNIEFITDTKIDYDKILIEGYPKTDYQKKIFDTIKDQKNLIYFGSCSENKKVNEILVGCPPSREEIKNFFARLIIGKSNIIINHPVCKECVESEVKCLKLDGIECQGPEIIGACSIICPKHKVGCTGCRTRLGEINAK